MAAEANLSVLFCSHFIQYPIGKYSEIKSTIKDYLSVSTVLIMYDQILYFQILPRSVSKLITFSLKITGIHCKYSERAYQLLLLFL